MSRASQHHIVRASKKSRSKTTCRGRIISCRLVMIVHLVLSGLQDSSFGIHIQSASCCLLRLCCKRYSRNTIVDTRDDRLSSGRMILRKLAKVAVKHLSFSNFRFRFMNSRYHGLKVCDIAMVCEGSSLLTVT